MVEKSDDTAGALQAAEAAAGHPQWIDTPEGLAETVSKISESDVIGIDTEFVRERTYWARPGLLQCSDGHTVWLVDLTALNDFRKIAQLLENPEIVKVLHSPGEDLEVLYRLCGALPRPLFDTQVAAACLGSPLQMGYEKLLEQELGVALEGGKARSDWLKRPLADDLKAYAAQDVAWLPLLQRRLGEKLQEHERLGWVLEECDAMLAGATVLEVGAMWWIAHVGWDEVTSWDPDFIYVPLIGAALLLGACAYLRPTEEPIPHTWHRTGPERSDTLLVLLPGARDTREDFVTSGFLDVLREHGPAWDAISVEAHLGYYRKQILLDRLEADILAPARERGYRHIWFTGPSLGGFGSLFYPCRRPADDIRGIIAIAPYLGDDGILADIRNAGGPAHWQPGEAGAEHEQQLWQCLKSGDLPDIWLAWGTQDRLAPAAELAAELVPASRVVNTEGGHDWKTWVPMWWKILIGIAAREHGLPDTSGLDPADFDTPPAYADTVVDEHLLSSRNRE